MSIPLWQRYADEFPVRQNLIYWNHAAVAPLSRRAAAAMSALADDARDFGSLHYDRWMACYEGLRRSSARLVNARPSEIAIVKNTSEGIAIVANGLPWRAGDKAVAFVEEFPANYHPWKRLEPLGVEVRWLSIFDPLDRIDEAAQGARLLAISFVNYLNGYRVDLDAIGEICARHNCLFFVDAIQGMGAFPIDVQRSHIAALSADGHKWMLGPEGCGVLYVREDVQAMVEPVEFGWTNTATYADYSSRDMTLRPNAARYECGTLNTIGCFGLQAAIDLLLEAGVEDVCCAVLDIARRLHAGLRSAGCETILDWNDATASGIVAFRKPGEDCHVTVRRLKEQGIIAAPRQGWVRASPHFYAAPEDLARFLAAVS